VQITVDFQDEGIAQKVLWFLSTLKDKGVKVVSNTHQNHIENDENFHNLQIDSMSKTWDNDFDKVWDEL